MFNRARWANRISREAHRVLSNQRGQFIFRLPGTAPPVPPPPDPTANLWVAPTGDDNRTKAIVAASGGSLPWQTITRACYGSANRSTPNASEAAAAGDVVGISPGIYFSDGQNDRFVPSYNPVNDGTALNPIVFKASGTVELRYTSLTGPVIGASGKNYITWLGPFYIDNAQAPSHEDTGPATFNGGATGCVFDGISILGLGPPPWIDNYPGIRLESTSFATIKNCTIDNFGGGFGSNEAGIQAYRSGNITIENNLIKRCGSGVFLKGIAELDLAGPWNIRYNKIEDTFRGVLIHRVGNTLAPLILIYQNIIQRCQYGVEFFNFGDDTNVKNTHFVNNTVYDTLIRDGASYCTGFGLRYNFLPVTAANCSINNNIFSVLQSQALIHQGTGDTEFDDHSNISFDRNLYYSYSDFCVLGLESVNTHITFAQWQAAPHNQDPSGINGSNPLFVNPGTDFHLQGGSPAASLGRVVYGIGGTNGTTIPAGCYISGLETIGPE